MKERKLNALLLLDATNIIYTVGYFHLSTERPLAALIPESGDPVMFVPGLETDQVKTWWVKDYESYFDYPGPVNRVRWIFERVAKRGLRTGDHRSGGAAAQPAASNKSGRAEGEDCGCRGPGRRPSPGQGRRRNTHHAPGHDLCRFQSAGRPRIRATQRQRDARTKS